MNRSYTARRQRSQSFHCGGNDSNCAIDLGGICGAAEAKTQTRTRFLRREADSQQNVRRLNRSGRASRSRGTRDALKVQSDDESFSACRGESQVRCVRNAAIAVTIHAHRRKRVDQLFFQTVAQCFNSSSVDFQVYFCQFGGFAEADDARNIFGTGTPVPLMMAAVKLRLKRRSCTDIERANTLGPIDFVRGDGEQMHAEALHVQRQRRCRLYRVAMKIDVSFSGDAANFFDGLNGAELVVRVHDAYQNRVGTKSAANILWIDDARGTNRNEGDVNVLLGECLSGIEDSVMLDGGGDYVLA